MRSKNPLSLTVADIDVFKDYNDTYGHVKGDNCLKEVAIALNKILKRPADMIARYGGEEFVIVLPDTEAKGAGMVAKAQLSEVESLGIAHSNSQVSNTVTVSLGVATFIPDKKSSPIKLVSAADQALYQAKDNGRNRLCVYDPGIKPTWQTSISK